jgi:plastocyanin
MKKAKWMFIAVGVVFLFTTVLFLGSPATVGATEQCSIVTIRGRENIEPLTVSVKKGDCVIWTNFTGGAAQPQDVKLIFKEGEKCIKATKSPTLFKLDVPSGCFIAGAMGYGQVASLIFTEPGTYKYEIEFKAGGKNSGAVIVK